MTFKKSKSPILDRDHMLALRAAGNGNNAISQITGWSRSAIVNTVGSEGLRQGTVRGYDLFRAHKQLQSIADPSFRPSIKLNEDEIAKIYGNERYEDAGRNECFI